MVELSRPSSLVAELAALGDGSRSTRRHLTAVCDRIDAVDSQVHAFVAEPGRRERLLRTVGAGETSPAGALGGVAVGVKDIVAVDGFRTRAGSSLPPELFDGPQATVVDRLLAAGAVVAGKTETAEFAVSAPGPTRNPHDLDHTPGGSSSGSAAAVAAGMVPLALGTQTIGSVIRPAAFCGVVGFRPSWGRIPTDGVIANAPSLDVVGVFAADLAGAALAAGVLADDWRPAGAAGTLPVLGVPVGPLLDRVAPAARAAFDRQLAVLRAAGFSVRAVPAVEDLPELVRTLTVINRYELARVHDAWYAEHAARYRPQTAQAIEEGRSFSEADHERAERHRRAATGRLLASMTSHGIDLWVTPAAPGPAPLGLGSTGDPVLSLPFSLAGLPAVTLPASVPAGSLPLGLQCVAGPGGDEQLLAWAAPVEAALGALSP